MKLAGSVFAGMAVVTALLILDADQALANHVQCGDVIVQDTILDSDVLGCSSPALTVVGDSLTLNLNGHVVEGGVSAPRTFPSRNRVVIENGTVRNGGVSVESYATVAISHITSPAIRAAHIDNHVVIENNTVVGDRQGGISIGFAPGEINDNVVRGGGTGVALGKGFDGSVAHNLIEGNERGMDMSHSRATLVENTVRANLYYGATNGQGGPYTWVRNVITGNGTGMRLGYGNVLEGNLITSNAGDGIATYSPVTLTGTRNTITANGQDGIHIAEGTGGSLLLSDSTVSGNEGNGISLSNFHTVEVTGTTTDRNGRDGIALLSAYPDSSSSATLTGNHAWFNGNLGIEAVPSAMGARNWAKHNGNPLECVPIRLCSTTGKPH